MRPARKEYGLAFPYPVVLFDLDGTLVDSASDIAAAVNRLLAELGHAQVDEATVRSWIGDGARQLITSALQHAGDTRTADAVMPRIPARRWGEIDDFGGIAVYLASGASSWHTGDVITIDGGYHSF